MRGLIPRPLRQLVFSPMARLYPKADWLPRPLRAKSTLQNPAETDARAIYLSRAFHDPNTVLLLISRDIRAKGYDPFSVIEGHHSRCNAADPLSRELYVDINTTPLTPAATCYNSRIIKALRRIIV